jgi:hypothetical protein
MESRAGESGSADVPLQGHGIGDETRAFWVYTEEGSRFLARFDPLTCYEGLEVGSLVIAGYSQSQNRRLKIVGYGSVPKPGARLTVSDEAIELLEIAGETLPVYLEEIVLRVVEVSPRDLFAKVYDSC